MEIKNFTNLTGKKAIVTGAAQGLCHGMAEGLLEAGAEVCIIDISPKTLEAAKEFCDRGYICHGVIADLGDDEDLENGFHAAITGMGGHLDILVNGAGVQKRHKSEEFPIEDWNFVININLNAVFKLCKLAGQQFLKQQSKGKIINIASMLSFFGGYTVPAYAASKGGVSQLTKALCNEWAAAGINVNALAPGYMDTEMNASLTEPDNPRYNEITDRIPAHIWGTPEDMKGPCVFLASAASDYLNGAVIPVDGGYLVR
ncbi:SDR family oxidoreductase [Lacrimispora sp.]|uniref:SDR family oxidoreductase n=1 Tax=Lacrimispora sp. TaxID=2719234 RepID=UPI002899D4D9|nr:SDR family oxidoreductase [Lacrimispora sp.]